MNRDICLVIIHKQYIMKATVIFTVFFFALVLNGYSHSDHNKKKASDSTHMEMTTTSAGEMHDTISAEMHTTGMTGDHHDEEMQQHHDEVMGRAEFSEFPTLHPLVVHFPIVLLLLAALLQFTGFFVFKKELSWITMGFLLLGVAGAWMASNPYHPHTSVLTGNAAWLLEQHEKYASLTFWAGLAALAVKIITHFFLKKKFWAEILVFTLLATATYFVSTTAHFGAQMTHIEGIGPQGHHLEMGDHDH